MNEYVLYECVLFDVTTSVEYGKPSLETVSYTSTYVLSPDMQSCQATYTWHMWQRIEICCILFLAPHMDVEYIR
jgi:hypothetical protein